MFSCRRVAAYLKGWAGFWLIIAFVFRDVTPANGLFGLRKKPATAPNASQKECCDPGSPFTPTERHAQLNQSSDTRPEPWVDQNGEIQDIKGVQEPSGLWRIPAGSIVPKDPQSMTRIIEIGNDLGEIFQCVIPKRNKPYNAEWLDIPQVPVIEDINQEDAESHLSALEGKCYYLVQGWWTYEFCYKSHVRQFHMDMNSKNITDEYMLGHYSASTPFEVHVRPDRLDHTQDLDLEGPAWTSSLVTVYGGGAAADQWGSNGWYTAEWEPRRWLGLVPFTRYYAHRPGSMHTRRPRQVAVLFKCLPMDGDHPFADGQGWLERAQLFLDGERVPFDMRVMETAVGVYELQAELSPVGDVEEEVTCQSLSTGQVYKLKDVPSSGRFAHKFRQAMPPFDPY